MSSQLVKKDNSYLNSKIKIRLSNTPINHRIKVLDCYAGKSILWKSIAKQRDIELTRIDKKKIAGALIGDNKKYLKSLKLDKYDIIDLDAYGIPYEQLKIIFENKYKGIVFITFIQSVYGNINKRLLNDIGYTKTMLEKTQTLFTRNGVEKLKRWLGIKGVKSWQRISINNKNYICMDLKNI